MVLWQKNQYSSQSLAKVQHSYCCCCSYFGYCLCFCSCPSIPRWIGWTVRCVSMGFVEGGRAVSNRGGWSAALLRFTSLTILARWIWWFDELFARITLGTTMIVGWAFRRWWIAFWFVEVVIRTFTVRVHNFYCNVSSYQPPLPWLWSRI